MRDPDHSAEQLVEQWTAERETRATPAERDLARFILRALADGHDELLDDAGRRRPTAPAPLRLVQPTP